jgi:hypothetical protein
MLHPFRISYTTKIGVQSIREYINTLFLVSYLILIFGFYIVSQSFKPLITLLILTISFSSLLFSQTEKLKTKISVNSILFWLILLLLICCIQLISGILNYYIIYLISSASFAYFIIDSKFKTRLIYIPFIAISIYVFISFITGKDLNEIFPDTSRNYISVILLTNISTAYLVDWRQNKTINIWFALITLVLSILAIGRSGILVSLFLLVGALILRYKEFSSKKKTIVSFALIIPLIVFLFINWNRVVEIYFSIDYFNRLTALGFKDNARELLRNSYFENLNIFTILFGYNYSNNAVFLMWNKNPHNSFIELHHKVGFLFFPIVAILFYTLIKFFKTNKVYFIITASILIRAFTDRVFFLTHYDYLLIALILIALCEKKKEQIITVNEVK